MTDVPCSAVHNVMCPLLDGGQPLRLQGWLAFMSRWAPRRSIASGNGAINRGDDPMRVRSIASVTAVILLFAVWPARSQSVPSLNVNPVCRGIAQQARNPSETGGPDLTFAACVKNEQAMRQKLVREWSMFSRSEKSNCIGEQMGGMASYTDLVSCLEMARDARQLTQGK